MKPAFVHSDRRNIELDGLNLCIHVSSDELRVDSGGSNSTDSQVRFESPPLPHEAEFGTHHFDVMVDFREAIAIPFNADPKYTRIR